MDTLILKVREFLAKNPLLSTAVSLYVGSLAERSGYLWKAVKVLFIA